MTAAHAPELVYGREGHPLTIIDDRRAVQIMMTMRYAHLDAVRLLDGWQDVQKRRDRELTS